CGDRRPAVHRGGGRRHGNGRASAVRGPEAVDRVHLPALPRDPHPLLLPRGGDVGMNERDFLTLAATLAGGPTEAEWRTAVGRAYYAAFHVARRLLEDLGFTVPRADRAHGYLGLRLQNCGDLPAQQAGADLDGLRRLRNRADYDLHHPVDQMVARV